MAAVPPVPPATVERPAAEHEGPARPDGGRGRAVLRGRSPGPVRPPAGRPPAPAMVPAREPLWRHVVGDVLRRERLGQGLRLKDVAEAARISMPYLSEIERGRKEASSEVLAAAARALGLGLAGLLELAQADLARFAPARRAGASDPVRPDQEAGAGQAVPATPDDPAGDDDLAGPAGRPGPRQAQAWLAGALEQISPPQQPGRTGPPQVRMSLAA
jgi:transcriptional regulator with XRE-family HTH domain